MTAWGELCDGQTATARRVSLVADGRCLALVDPEGCLPTTEWTWKQVQAAPPPTASPTLVGPAGATLTLLFPWPPNAAPRRPATFVTAGQRFFFEALLQGDSPAPAGSRRWMVAAVASMALTALAFLHTDRLAQWGIQWVPRSWDSAVEQALCGALRRNICDSDESRMAFDQLAHRLSLPGKGPVAPHIHLAHLGQPNAFALPGGTILIDPSLLAKMTTPEELAGIVAHEMAHVELRHGSQALLRSIVSSSLWTALLGDYSGMVLVDPATAVDLLSLRFSRQAEAEADAWAIERLLACRIDPASSEAFFLGLEKPSKVPSFLSTHPPTPGRAAAFAAASRTFAGDGIEPIIQQALWEQLIGSVTLPSDVCCCDDLDEEPSCSEPQQVSDEAAHLHQGGSVATPG